MTIEQLARLSEGEKPFALFLSIGTPHDPWVPENVPADCLERFQDKTFRVEDRVIKRTATIRG